MKFSYGDHEYIPIGTAFHFQRFVLGKTGISLVALLHKGQSKILMAVIKRFWLYG